MDGVLDLKLEVTHAIKIKKHNIIDNHLNRVEGKLFPENNYSSI
jgi:hypothetical protein